MIHGERLAEHATSAAHGSNSDHHRLHPLLMSSDAMPTASDSRTITEDEVKVTTYDEAKATCLCCPCLGKAIAWVLKSKNEEALELEALDREQAEKTKKIYARALKSRAPLPAQLMRVPF